MKILSTIKQKITFGILSIFVSATTFAKEVTSTYPWDDFLSKILADLQSNFAIFFGITGIIFCAAMIIFGNLQGGARKAFNVGLGCSVILNAASIMSLLFSSGALVR